MKYYLLTFLAIGSIAGLSSGCSGGKLPDAARIQFSNNSANLGVFQKDELLRVGQKMECMNYSVFLLADEKKQGKAMANKRLNAVRAVLLEAGVSKEDIASGFVAPRELQVAEQDVLNDANNLGVVVLYMSK